MLKRLLVLLLGVWSCFLLSGCAKPPPPDSQKLFTPYRFAEDTYLPKVSAFMVLLDCSASMGDAVGGKTKLDLAKDFVYRMSLTLPMDDFHAVLRTFGHNPLVSFKNTRKSYDDQYERITFHLALNRIGLSGGQSPMRQALVAAGKDIENIEGNIALLIVSDGNVAGESAIAAAKGLKNMYGERLCIYPVMTGKDAYGRSRMEALASTGECGFLTDAQSAMSKVDMGRFVSGVFLKGHPDTDGDGVDDRYDQCPQTPPAADVDSRGCWVVGNIEYAPGQWEVRPEYYVLLDGVYRILKQNPELKVEIQGHTDNTGDAEFNKELSLNRASAVKRYLVSQGIDADRLTAKGYGESRPIATNQSEAGREANRRVELKPITDAAD